LFILSLAKRRRYPNNKIQLQWAGGAAMNH
jgi:hypothetical protein